MSQLSIGIGIKLDMAIAVLAAGGGEALVEHSAWSPPDSTAQAHTNAAWTLLTGTSQGIQQTNSIWYPAKTGSYTGVLWSTLPVALLTNDNYMQMEAFGGWTSVNDWIGPALRMSDTQESFYAFLVDGNDDYVIKRVFEGAETDVKTGALGVAIVPGSIIRIEALGDVITAYIDGNLIDTYTDVEVSKNTTGGPGVVAEGLGSSNQIVNFYAGDLDSEGNLGVYGDFAHNSPDDRYYTDSCFTSSPEQLLDGELSSTGLHLVSTVPHWIELDFLDFRVPSKIRVHGITQGYYDWTDVDILTKLNIGDDWVEVATALDMDNDGIDGWKTSADFSIIQPCRYVRIEINATLDGSNFCGTEEIEFYCTSQP